MLTRSMLPSLLQNASREADSRREADLRKYLQAKQPEIAGQEEEAKTKADLSALSNPDLQSLVNEGGSVSAGTTHIGGNPYAKMAMQGPRQAETFLKNAQGAYKGINDQLDASRATVEALNQGNAVSDKRALLNEAKLALAGSGGRAFGQVVDLLSGGKTGAGSLQDKINWVNNTQNIPTMQPAWRDAIREDVFSRIPEIESTHNQASQQLAQQGPVIAPQADYGTITKSLVEPAQKNLDYMKGLQSQYSQAKAKMAQGNPVSQPAQANANPTTMDRLKGFFGKGQAQPQPQAQAQQAPQDPIAAELAKRMKQQPQAPQGR